jgi:hypothetical protein
VHNGRKNLFADELCHACRRGDISGGKRRKAGRIHVTDIAVKGDRLAVPIDQKDDTGGALDT